MAVPVTAIDARTPRAPGVAVDDSRSRRAANADIPARNVAAALAQETSLHLAESIRTYSRRARANGDSVQEVLEVLMGLVRDTTPERTAVAKRSCAVAEWAIAAYFDEPESIRVASWRAKPIRRLVDDDDDLVRSAPA